MLHLGYIDGKNFWAQIHIRLGLGPKTTIKLRKNARSQIVQLTATVKTYEAHYKNQAIAMAELRVSESAARADSDRLRSRIANLEKGARTAADRDAIRCLQLGAECRRLLQEARGIINYCRKAL